MFRSHRRGSRAALALVLAASTVAVVAPGPVPVSAAPPAANLTVDLNPGAAIGVETILGAVGELVILQAMNGTTGMEPYVHNPATGTTTLLADLEPGGGGSTPTVIGVVGNRLIFTAFTSAIGSGLYATDGTPAGTVLLKDANPTSVVDNAQFPVGRGAALDGFVYLNLNDGVVGDELWRTDGTAAGTTLVADISPGALGTSFTSDGATLNGHLYFVAEPAGGVQRLWRTDGTSPGTTVIEPTIDAPISPVALADRLVFSALEPGGDRVLYSTTGAPGAAAPVQDLAAPHAVAIIGIGAANGRAWVRAEGSADATRGLWVTDGTAAGTVQLISDASLGIDTTEAVPFGNGVAMRAGTAATGTELLLSDGTPAGTRLVEAVPGVGDLDMRTLVPHADGWLYFRGFDGVDVVLVRTDGTSFETVTSLAAASEVMSVGDRVFFLGFTSALGDELYVVVSPPPVPSVAGTPVATAGSLSAVVSWSASGVLPAAPVTGYTVTASPGGATCSTTGALSCTVSGLTAGVPYTFTVRATNRIGSSAASAVSNAVVPTAPPVASVSPGRILETRVGDQAKTVDGLFQGIGRLAAGSTLELTVAGRSNVAADASAAMLNVTAVLPGADGFVTVFPCGEDRPNTSSVNFRARQVVPNAVLAKIGAGGKVCVFTTAETDLLVDVNGAVPAGGSPVTVSPARLLETRAGDTFKTVDGQFQGIGQAAAGSTVELLVAGRGNVPSNASAVMVNVTAVVPGADGFVTVFPCGEDRPNASSVNFRAGQVVPNAVLAKVGAGGKVCLFTTAATDLLVDVSGFVPAGSSPAPLNPARLLETRSGEQLKTVDGLFQGIGRAAGGSTVELQVTGRGNVPSNATSVMLNVTAVVPGGPGFVTVFPCGEDRPNASSLNYQTGQVVPNAVLAKIGAGGKVCLFTTAATDLLVDVTAAI